MIGSNVSFVFFSRIIAVGFPSLSGTAATRTRGQYAASSGEKPGSTKDVPCDVFGSRRSTSHGRAAHAGRDDRGEPVSTAVRFRVRGTKCPLFSDLFAAG